MQRFISYRDLAVLQFLCVFLGLLVRYLAMYFILNNLGIKRMAKVFDLKNVIVSVLYVLQFCIACFIFLLLLL